MRSEQVSYNIIGDIAGDYKALLALVEKMPEGTLVSVGDMVDRGPNSREVLDFFRSRGLAVKGNHEDMWVNSPVLHLFNGGEATHKSFEGVDTKEYKDYVDNLPLELFLDDGLLVTHTGYIDDPCVERRLWHRHAPERYPGYFNVFGHNSQWGLRYFDDYAVCIDTSQDNILTGMHWPSREVFQVERAF